MATIKTSALIADIRGSVGGNVFARNKAGLYARARIKPLNPRSALQQLRRAKLSAAAAYWSQLTAQVRADWQAYATNTSWTNRLGDSINIGGEAAFIRLVALWLMYSSTIPTAAPTAYGHASATITTMTASEATQTPIITDPSAGWDKSTDDDVLFVFGAMPQPASRAMAPNRYQFLRTISGNSGAPQAFPFTLPTWPWTFAEGQKLTIGLVHIDPDTRVSVRTFASCFAAA